MLWSLLLVKLRQRHGMDSLADRRA